MLSLTFLGLAAACESGLPPPSKSVQQTTTSGPMPNPSSEMPPGSTRTPTGTTTATILPSSSSDGPAPTSADAGPGAPPEER